jgi:hypothetical protein
VLPCSSPYKRVPYSLFLRLSCNNVNHNVYDVNRLGQITNKRVKNISKKFNKTVDIINGTVYNMTVDKGISTKEEQNG